MTSPVPEVETDGSLARAARRHLWRGYATWLGLHTLLAIVLGAIASLIWVWGTPLPHYLVRDDGSAVITERGMTEFFAADAVFVLLGLGVGTVLGLVGWRWLRGLGWWLPLVASSNALLAALACWGLGTIIGPGPLRDRLERAHNGDLVPIQHQLHALSALAVWPFAASMLLLAAAALAPDPEEGLSEPAETALPPAGPKVSARALRSPRPRAPRLPAPSSLTSPPRSGFPQGPQLS